MQLTESERRVIQIFKGIALCYSFLYPLIFGITVLSNKWGLTLGTFILLFILHLISFGLRSSKVHKYLYLVYNNLSQSDIKGNWHLTIIYTGKDGKNITRNGICTIEKTFTGHKIFGDQIFNSETEEVEVDTWVAENAEIFKYEKKEYLIYRYTTYDTSLDDPTKLGVVNAEKVSADRLEGFFRDITVDDGKTLKEGIVTLQRKK